MTKRFQKQMTRLDRHLYLEFNKKIGRYIVYRKDRQGVPRQILVVETADGSFCRPSYEHIVKLYKMDSWSNKNLIKDIDTHNDSLDDEYDEHNHRLSGEISKLATRSAYF